VAPSDLPSAHAAALQASSNHCRIRLNQAAVGAEDTWSRNGGL